MTAKNTESIFSDISPKIFNVHEGNQEKTQNEESTYLTNESIKQENKLLGK